MIAIHTLPHSLAAILLCQLTITKAVFTNTTTTSALSSPNTGISATHNGTDAVGDIIQCIGPTPPPGLSFPIETVVEKLTSVSGPTTGLYMFGDAHGEWTSVPFTATGPTTIYTTFTRQQVPDYDPYNPNRACCGRCTVYFSTVDVMYWPVPGANTACLNSGVGSNGPPSSLATVPPSNNSVSTTVGPDGFTYTSPLIYVAYHDISASDKCGQVGPKHTSITLSFLSDQLSTLDYEPGMFQGPFGGTSKAFDLKNLPCPPQSLLDAQESANQPGLSLPQRGTYAPIIAPPPYIRSLEPAWKSCVSFYAFDPPRTLSPATALVPSPTPANQAGAQITPAMPSATFASPPLQTSNAASPVEADPPSNPVDPKSAGDPKSTGDPTTSVDPTTPEDPATPKNPTTPEDPTTPKNPTTPEDPTTINPADPKDPPNNGETGSSNTQGNFLGPGASTGPKDPLAVSSIGVPTADIPQADPNSISQSNGNIPQNPKLPVIAVGSQTLTVLPSGSLAIAGSTIKAHSPAITVEGLAISLGDSALVAGSLTVYLPSGNANGVFTAAGLVVTPLGASSIAVVGNTLSINGAEGTISGTAMSLASSGLIIGTETFAIPTPAPDPKSNPGVDSAFTLAGQTFTPLGRSTIAVAGSTFSINGPAATISGTAVSVASSGLIIGTKTFAIPTPAPEPKSNPSANSVFTIASQTFTPLSDHRIAINGATLSVNGPATTVSGTLISLASSGLVIAGQTFPLPTPTPTPGKVGDTVVIDGSTLTAGGSAVTIAGTPLSLAIGGDGPYVSGLGSGSVAFSAPVVAGESVSLNAAGQLVVDGSTVTQGASAGNGGLASVILAGFGPANSMAGTAAATAAAGSGLGVANATAGMLGFTGGAERMVGMGWAKIVFSACAVGCLGLWVL